MNSVNEVTAAMGLQFPSEAQMREQAQAARDEVMACIRSKWPEAEWGDLRNGNDVYSFLRAARQGRICASCLEGETPLCDGRRYVCDIFRDEFQGHPRYEVRFRPCPLNVAREAGKTTFDRLFEQSGLSEKQRGQTFQAYETSGLGSDIRKAKGIAMVTAEEGSWLILAGLRGTGKSHLAVAIMLEVMKRGKQALFRLTPEMLDGLRSGFREEKRTYEMQMQALKEVPCLVLDDVGKERYTDAGCDFLYQIIDARYREKRQTIITTNAASREELISWGRADILSPIISRMDEMGNWLCIEKAEDYRVRIGNEKNKIEKPVIR